MIQFSSEPWEGLDGVGEEILRERLPSAERAVTEASIYFVAELKRTLSGSRSGRTYRVSRTGELHVASAPGEPPAVLNGALRNSIGYEGPRVSGLTVESEVGSGLGGADPAEAYGRRLEFGGADSRGVVIEPRPWMEPTADRVEPHIEDIFRRAL